MGQSKFYAVRAGRNPGVFMNWDDCQESVIGFKGANFKSFTTQPEAEAYATGGRKPAIPTTSSGSGDTRFYGVASGRNPGVYTNWADTQQQVKDWKFPKYRKFASRSEAEAFVRAGRGSSSATGGSLGKRKSLDEDIVDEVDLAPAAKKHKGGGAVSSDPLEDDDNAIASSVAIPAPKRELPARIENAEAAPLRIYTDGSSLGNGKLGAVAGVGVFFGNNDPRNISEPLEGQVQTNQRAELTAIFRALEIAPLPRDVSIYTDSNYSINCLTVWYKSWEKNNWQTSAKKPVMNKDLVQNILVKIRERQKAGSITKFNWIKGHSTDPGNVAADGLAVSGAQRSRALNGRR